MSSQYSRDHCKIAVGKILQTIGWHSINSTPLEVLTDIMSKYIQQISKITMDYTNEFGNTEPNLDHLGLAFQEMGISLSELEEYVTYVNFGPGPNPTPKFPIPKENNLNFLKPGSKEVVTRPVHVHEHLPPMHPLLEGTENEVEDIKVKQEDVDESPIDVVGTQHFKKPADVSPEFRRPKKEDEGGRPTREISSVMMTTSGFLSPAREGKLPEAKAPAPPPPPEQPAPLSTPTGDSTLKKKEKRKEKIGKELFKPSEEKSTKKVPTMKDFVKMKQKVAASNAAAAAAAAAANAAAVSSTGLISPSSPSAAGIQHISQQMSPITQTSDIKVNVPNVQKALKDKFDKALAAAKAKTEKLNTTITPIPAASTPAAFQPVEKLFNEPDKKKVNIFKKISNVKEGKVKKDSRANTPNMIMEEDIVNKIALSRDITIEPINPGLQRKSDKFDFFDDGAIPPMVMHRSPDMLNQGLPMQKEKRKRKDTRKVKRPKKNQNYMGTDIADLGKMEGQKNADAILSGRLHQSPHMGLPSMHPGQLPFPFLANFSGPGLIPPPLTSPLNTPLFPFSHMGTFGKNPFFPTVPQNISPQAEPITLVSPKCKDPVEIKQTDVVSKPSPKIIPPKISAPPKTTPNTKVTPKMTPPSKSSPKSTAPIQLSDAVLNTLNVPPQTAIPLTVPVSKDIISHDTSEIKDKKIKEHKKEKKDKIKKKNKKDKVKEKSEKKKLKELKKDNKEKMKKEKKIKKREEKEMKEVKEPSENPIPKILLKVNSPSPRPETPESVKKLNIKPVVRKEEASIGEANKREPSPGGLAKISALVTGPPKPKTSPSPVIPAIVEKSSDETPLAPVQKQTVKPKISPVKIKQHKSKKTEQTFKKVDELGNVVWICPACGQQDDGRPMIGCDGCDAWYHWVCVGIQVPPDENENWYCKPCLCKKNEDLQSDKKRKRKKKEKKDQ